MVDFEYKPVAHDRDEFLERALKREGFVEAYAALEEEYRAWTKAHEEASALDQAKPHSRREGRHLGSDFDDFLRSEEVFEAAEAVATQRVRDFEASQEVQLGQDQE